MKTLILAALFTQLLFGCRSETKTSEFSDDYVLIEFAARLEEDYERLYPQPLDKLPKQPTE